jgi:hypothetical protein
MCTRPTHALCPAAGGRHRARRAAALLEVVVALGILLMAMAGTGIAFRNCLQNIERAERMSRAVFLTDRLIGEMDTGALVISEEEATGTLEEESMPGMSWRVVIQPLREIPGLLGVEVEVFMGDPDAKPDDREHVLSSYFLRSLWQPINLERDFGLTVEQVEKMKEAVPGGEAVFDPTNFDPRSLASLDMDTLGELMPVIMQAFGGPELAAQIDQLMQAAESGQMPQMEQLPLPPGTTPPAPPPRPPRSGIDDSPLDDPEVQPQPRRPGTRRGPPKPGGRP